MIALTLLLTLSTAAAFVHRVRSASSTVLPSGASSLSMVTITTDISI